MPAYVVIVEEQADRSFEEDRQRLIAWGKQHGGKYLAVGPPSQVVEGDLEVRRVVLIEFETVAAAQKLFETAEYAAVRDARAKAGYFASVVIAAGV